MSDADRMLAWLEEAGRHWDKVKPEDVRRELGREDDRVAQLEAALDAIWDYEESVQRDLKARDEVSDGTMHKLLRAKDLRAKVKR